MMADVGAALALSFAAGVCGTAAGGAVACLLRQRGTAMVAYLLSFAAGVMLAILFADLLPQALAAGGLGAALFGMSLGVLAVGLASRLPLLPGGGEQASLQRTGWLVLLAIALHNLPEGVAVGGGAAHSQSLGLGLALLIALHNIPEGLGIAAPLLAGGMRPARVLWLSAACGLPTLLGGALGFILGRGGAGQLALALSFAAGAMLYVSAAELLPQALRLGRRPRVLLLLAVGLALGLALVRAVG